VEREMESEIVVFTSRLKYKLLVYRHENIENGVGKSTKRKQLTFLVVVRAFFSLLAVCHVLCFFHTSVELSTIVD
jgi:nitrate reductase NapE component